jgi:hypothetical protein
MSKILDMTWATHEALRRLGFKADDIYVSVQNTNQAFVILKVGNNQFNICIGEISSEAEYYAEWNDFATAIMANKIPEEKLQKIWEQWLAENSGLSLVISLKMHGFTISDRTLN